MVPKVYALDISNPSVNPVARFGNITSLVNLLLPLLTIGGGLLFLVSLLWGGFTYTTSSGDAEKVQKAKKIIMYSIIGLAFVAFSFLIVNILSLITGVKSPLNQ